MTFRRASRPRPELDYEVTARDLALPKPRKEGRTGPVDTRGLHLRKLHPERDPEYRAWLRLQPCVVEGKTNNRTGVKHECWSPDGKRNGRYLSDAMHVGKSFSGRLKQSDRGAIPGCRHFHREAEANMDRADADYGIDRFALANEHYAQFQRERGDR